MKPSPMDLIATIIRTSGRKRLTDRTIIEQMLARMTAGQRERHYNDSCYYYESREGPYDYLIERALTYGIIAWDGKADRYVIGPGGKGFGVAAARKRGK